MFRIVSCFAAFAIASLGTAQTTTIPPKGADHEGNYSSAWFGSYPEGRYQFIDGSLRGQPMVFKALRFRADYRSHNALAIGRSWRSVELRLSETKQYSLMSPSFAANLGRSPTLVFSGAMVWPTQSGYPSSYPAPWGGRSGSLGISFTTPWLHLGNDDLLLDYTLLGGQLANQGAWWSGATGTKGPNTQPLQRHYHLDGEAPSTRRHDGVFRSLPLKPAKCVDGAFSWPTSNPAHVEGQTWIATGGGKDTFLRLRSLLTAPSAPVIQAISPRALPVGQQLGFACQPLILDPSSPWILIGAQTGPRVAYSPWVQVSTAWAPSLSRAQLWVQAAWTDSVTHRLSLTTAAHLTLPYQQPHTAMPRQKAMYSLFVNASTADVGPIYSAYQVLKQLRN